MLIDKKTKFIVKNALKEDIGKKDITTSALIPVSITGEAVLIAKEEGVLCGIDVAREVFRQIDKKIVFKSFKKDGYCFRKNEKIALIRGSLRKIIIAERVALNFLASLSGIATFTREFVKTVSKTKAKILDTRKTTPNLRNLEKYAVKMGGGHNHRKTLSDGILIKDNHLRILGCIKGNSLNEEKIRQSILCLRKWRRKKIEIEVENLKEFKSIIKYKPDIVMLDNFNVVSLRAAVIYRNKYYPKIKLEASGGIKLKNIREIAKTGVDFISLGRITHSSPAIDFSLEIK